MPKLHMTDVVVSRRKFNGTYYDEMTPAFGLRVGKNRKTWFVVRGRERLRTNIGQYPATSLADARKKARKLLTEEPTKADRITFNAAYDIYKEALKNKKERTHTITSGSWRNICSRSLAPRNLLTFPMTKSPGSFIRLLIVRSQTHSPSAERSSVGVSDRLEDT
jgi:Arm domain-containing DNA-binding protein